MAKSYYTWDKVKDMLEYPEVFGHLIGKTAWNHIQREWMKYMFCKPGEQRSLQAHRNSYKTSCITEMLPLLYLARNPNETIGIVKKQWTNAADSIHNLAGIAQTPVISEFLEFVWGEKWKFTTNAKGRLSFSTKKSYTKECNIEALSIHSSSIGKHFSVLFFDDVIDIDDRISTAEREHTKLVVQDMRHNVLNRGGVLLSSGTPWHRDDAWSCFPAPIKYPVSATGILSPEQLAEKRKEYNPLMYACNYDLEFMNDEMCLFKEPIMGKWHFGELKNIQAQIDTAFGGDCYSALTIIGQFPDGKFNAVGFVYPMNINEHLSDIVRKLIKYEVKRVHVEKNADKGFFAAMLRINDDLKRHHIWVRDYDETTNKHHKIGSYGVEAWQSTEWADETDKNYLEQCVDYIDEKSKPDDAPDSFSSLIREANFSITKNYLDNFMKAWNF